MEFLYIIGIGALGGLLISFAMKKRRGSKTSHLDIIEEIMMGKYLAGFDSQWHQKSDSFCNVTNEVFYFSSTTGGKIGLIGRDSITDIFLEDKSHVGQRITATRLLTLGVFSLAAPKKKKHKEYCIVFEWEDEDMEKNNAVFEFTGMGSEELAKQAFDKLKKYKPITTKKCPFCDETIKIKASVCKHCQKELS